MSGHHALCSQGRPVTSARDSYEHAACWIRHTSPLGSKDSNLSDSYVSCRSKRLRYILGRYIRTLLTLEEYMSLHDRSPPSKATPVVVMHSITATDFYTSYCGRRSVSATSISPYP
ncbi:hypothetical protein OH76DRAFT_459072 [Lentinus brumalis]|uniref:Uncharacterized protein n=1 Tax=Lentinus brumalis TaxID=2498619 RepID=A0A371DDI7_9APHY|nr:hypothetical protein OH76DRAFT_459072 [Polyporus brumalis]